MPKGRRLSLESGLVFVQAALIGLLAGGLGVGFRKVVVWLQERSLGSEESTVAVPLWACLVVPTVGGLLAGLCIAAVRNERSPFGVADVIEIVITRTGTIRPLRSFMHTLSSAFSIASGGSIGREGANSQIGATMAAWLGRLFRVPSRQQSVLLGCGIAAGMASAYMAPIAGALFVMEVVLGNFAMDVLAPIVVASVVSTLVTAHFFEGFIYSATVEILDPWLVLSSALLGAMCGLGGIAFRRSLALGKIVFDRVPVAPWLRLGLGGLIVGAIGIGLPEVWGNGQRTIETIIDPAGAAPLWFLALLLLGKVVATSVTTGSGALGGVFTPNMVVGAAFGAAFWEVLRVVMPDQDHRIGFALVGMAGLCAASTHAPITAIILVFELTGDYGLILPLMLCSIIASSLARLIDGDSIYSERLRARGHALHSGIEELAMHSNYVRDVMRRDVPNVAQTAPFDDVLELFNTTRDDTIYVVDPHRVLVGHIRLHDVKQFINDVTLGSVVIAADLARVAPSTRPDESLAAILPRFDDPELDELPVVASGPDPLLIGRITRRDLVAHLSDEVLGQRRLRTRLRTSDARDADPVELPAGARVERLPVPDALVGRAIHSLDGDDVESLALLMVIEHHASGSQSRSLPRPDLVLGGDMELVVLGDATAIEAFRRRHGLAGSRQRAADAS